MFFFSSKLHIFLHKGFLLKYNYLFKADEKEIQLRSVIKRPTDSTTSVQTSTTSGQTSTTNGQTNGQTSTTSEKTSTTSGETSTTSGETRTTSR